MKKKIFSIIVTFNPDLFSFNEVLMLHLKTNTDGLIIIDNGSSNKEQLLEIITKYKEFSIQIETFFLDENKGIAFAQNLGINKAKNELCTHVLLFDQDSFVPKDFVDNLMMQEEALIAKGYKVGAIGPVYIDSVTNSYYPQILVKYIFVNKVWPDKIYDENIQVSFIIASGSLIKIETLEKVGLMNEGFFIDCVDIEWCFRASNMGYLIFASKSVIISHTIGDNRKISLGREISIHSPIRRYYGVRNNILMTRMKWVPIGYRIRIFLGMLFKTPIHLYDVGFNLAHVKHTGKAFWDGFLNNNGKIKGL